MRRLEFLLAAGILCGGAFAGIVKPDFSGVWLLNNDKSEPRGKPDRVYTCTITQDKETLTIATKAEGVKDLLDGTYQVNGKFRIAKVGNNYRFIKASWEGATLVLELSDRTSKKDDAKFVMYIRESWQLSFDGKTITKLRRVAENGTVTDQKFVFDKQ